MFTTQRPISLRPNFNEKMSTVEAAWRYGRYVCQLQRLHLYFCRYSGSSRGMRDFLDKGVVSFAEKNPSIAIYINEKKGEHPLIQAKYLSGKTHEVLARNLGQAEIEDTLEQLRNQGGKLWISDKVRKTWHTDKPSIQGTWNPLLHKPAPDISE